MKQNYDLNNLQKLDAKKGNSHNTNDIIKKNGTLHNLLDIYSSFHAIVDMTTLGFTYVSPSIKNVLGYSNAAFKKSGLNKIFELYHPDIKLTQKAMHKRIGEFFASLPPSTHSHYVFSFDLQLKNKSGKYIKLLQHNRILKVDKSGMALLVLIVCHDLTHFKTEQHHTLTLQKIEKNGLKTLFIDEFCPEYENGILTKKETVIWKHINNGLSSKEIGEILNISVHTVNTHRKKICKKLKSN